MTDKLISLQAAIDALVSCTALEWEQLKKCYPMLEVLEDLPPAEPDQRSFSCGQENDTISRRAAKHALCKAVHKNEDIPCENQTASCLWSKTRVCDYAREIDALPSAEPERKENKYKIGYADGYHKAESDYYARTATDRDNAFKMGIEVGRGERKTREVKE